MRVTSGVPAASCSIGAAASVAAVSIAAVSDGAVNRHDASKVPN